MAWLRFTPGEISDNPFLALAMQLKSRLEPEGWTARTLAAHLYGLPVELDDLCSRALGEASEMLIFIDQFEELFTLVRADLRAPFIDMLGSICNAKHTRVLATMRSDFYHHCLARPQLAGIMETGQFPLSTPKLGALYDMITKPAVLAGLSIEKGLVQRILDDTGSEPGTLALLAYTLDELYQACMATRHLTFAKYELLGGVQGAIGKRAESAYAALNEITKQQLPDAFRELVEVDERGVATRRRVALDCFPVDGNARKLVDAFINARLLTSDGDGSEAVVEVAHEALFRNWRRLAGVDLRDSRGSLPSKTNEKRRRVVGQTRSKS